MSLQLDARQRAMLQEMGITIWQPAEKPPARVIAEQPAAQPATAHADTAVLEAAAPPVARPAPVERPPRVERPTPAPAVAVPAPAQQAAGAMLHAAQALYPNANADAIPPELGASWLIVFEAAVPGEPLAGDVGKLLDNMLRAMQLHRHPRTYACVLERAGSSTGNASSTSTAAPVETMLAQTLAELQPSLVLILGLGAARAILDSREPLGRLRAMQHQLRDATPAVVSYDPAYLLRAPEAKASAWADLCRALAIVRKASTATP